MTDRERAEQALKDAGYELSEEPYSGAHWWHALHEWTARFMRGLNEALLVVGVPVRSVPFTGSVGGLGSLRTSMQTESSTRSGPRA